MSLLPSSGPDASATQSGDYEVVGVDENVDDVIEALSSDTARAILNAIYEEPGTPSEIADRLDTSIQNVTYHLDNLEEQDLIAVAGTRYSEKGQEMKVYEPPEDPLVLFVGTPDRKQTLKSLVKRLVPAGLLLALASVAVNRWFDPGGPGETESLSSQGGGDTGGVGGGDGGGAAGGATATPTPEPEIGIAEATPTPAPTSTPAPAPTEAEVATQTTAAAGGAGIQISPGLAFLLGGLFVLVLVVVWWGWQTYGE
ncbi:MAG: ArsR/SmtB family transcription factor [Haloarculaceae archaeon]